MIRFYICCAPSTFNSSVFMLKSYHMTVGLMYRVTCINPAENYLLQAHRSSLGHFPHCPDRTPAWSAARRSANIKSVSLLKLAKPQGRSWPDKRGSARIRCEGTEVGMRRSVPQQDLQRAGLIKERRGGVDRIRLWKRIVLLLFPVYLRKQIWP